MRSHHRNLADGPCETSSSKAFLRNRTPPTSSNSELRTPAIPSFVSWPSKTRCNCDVGVTSRLHSLTLASQTALVRIQKQAAAEQNGSLSCGQDISGTLNRTDGRTIHGLFRRAIASKYCGLRNLAERGGFEPPVQVLARTTV